MKRDILITDIDNTIYNFVDFFGPAFRSMIHAISGRFDISEDILYSEFQKFYSGAGSVEHQDVISHLPQISQLSPDNAVKVMETGRRAFDKTRKIRLQPYPGIVDTLFELHLRGVLIIGLTNAPIYQAIRRLRVELKVLRYFSGFAGFVGTDIDFLTDDSGMDKFVREYSRVSKNLDFLIYLKKEELKPSTLPFKKIFDATKSGARNIYALGDSVQKDLLPARSIGSKTIWAKYGTKIEQKNFDTLLRITPWSKKQIASHTGPAEYQPDYSINDPTAILDIIEGTHPTLFQ